MDANHYSQTFPSIEVLIGKEKGLSDQIYGFAAGWEKSGKGGGLFLRDDASPLQPDGGIVLAAGESSAPRKYIRIFDGNPQVTFWQAAGDGSSNDVVAFNQAIAYLSDNIDRYSTLAIPPGSYLLDTSKETDTCLNIARTEHSASGISFEGLGSANDTQLIFPSGSGLYFNSALSEPGMWRINLRNLHITGKSSTATNTTANAFGVKFEKCSIISMQACTIDNFQGAGSSQLYLQDVFNFKWEGGNISGGVDDQQAPQGAYGVFITSDTDPEASWVSSNIQFFNTLIQRNAIAGVSVAIHQKTMDDLRFDNVEFGRNGYRSFECADGRTSVVSNISFTNCHFEAPGTTGYDAKTGQPILGNFGPEAPHILLTGEKSGLLGPSVVNIACCIFVDAYTSIDMDSISGFVIENAKVLVILKAGESDMTAFCIKANQGNTTGRIGPNQVFSNQIKNRLLVTASNGHKTFIDQGSVSPVSQNDWSGTQGMDMANNPELYACQLYGVTGGQSSVKEKNDAPYRLQYTDGSQDWYRVMLSKGYLGERPANLAPEGEPGEVGQFYLNSTPVAQTDPSTSRLFSVFGWQYLEFEGQAQWCEMLTLLKAQ